MKKFLPKTVNNSSGFTLVELMVVVTILAILSVVGFGVFTGAQKNARDGRRMSDVDAIAKLLEANYQAGATNPYQAVQTNWFTSNVIPADPGTYTYTYPTTAATSYCVCAQLENAKGNYGANNCSTAGTTFYCRKNQQ